MSFNYTSPVLLQTGITALTFENNPPYEWGWANSAEILLYLDNWGNVNNTLTVDVYWGVQTKGLIPTNANIIWKKDTALTVTYNGSAGIATNISAQIDLPIMKSRYMKLGFTLAGTTPMVDVTAYFYGRSESTAAKVPAMGTAGIAATDVMTVQGIASGTPQPISGDIAAAAADSGNPVKVGGKYNLTQPTYADLQRGDLQLDARGNLKALVNFTTNSWASAGDSADAVAATASTSRGIVVNRPSIFNGTSWDRQYGNYNTITGDTGAKTVTFNGATQTNFNARGATILFNIGTVTGTTPTLTAKIQGSADSGTTWYDIPSATTPSIIATGTTVITIYGGVTAAANAAISYPLPRTWRVVYTIGGTTPSFTITNVQVAYLV